MLSTLALTIMMPPPNTDDLFNISKADWAIFNLKDNQNHNMDCLKVQPLPDGTFLGLSHTLINNVFHLRLATSANAKSWTFRQTIDTHAHQGFFALGPKNQVLLTYEKDIPQQGNHIEIRYYSTLNDLFQNQPTKSKTIPRTYSPGAEGTPSLHNINWDASPPTATVRFHYYKNLDVDRQAIATLDKSWIWSPQKQPQIDTAIEALGIKGNIGDRDQLSATNLIIEGMKIKDDWSTWQLFNYNTKTQSATQIHPQTPKNSQSFANPNVTHLANKKTIVTLFLPSQGNHQSEAGQLIYQTNTPN